MANIYDYLDCREFVRDFVEDRRKEKAGFSLRFLAQRTGCDPGFFNKVINGERALSIDLAGKLGELLGLSKREQEYFEALALYNRAKSQSEKSRHFKKLQKFSSLRIKNVAASQYPYFENWYVVALRELLHVITYRDDVPDIDRKIARCFTPPITPAEARKAIDTLKRTGFIIRKENGVYALSEAFISSGPNPPAVVVNNFLIEFMDLAKQSIDRFSREERSLATLTFNASKSGYEKIRTRLDEMRREILDMVKNDLETSDRVYHLNMHLFPLTKQQMGELP